MKKIKSAIVISDIRNFTGTFERFQEKDNDSFINFISDFYEAHISIASKISKDYWYNSLGDSMVFLFKGLNHSKHAYAFSILLHKKLTKMVNEFNAEFDEKISFGIGVDCGETIEMLRDGRTFTYLGNVINVVSRIEKLTKLFGETELLVGSNIYNYIMRDFYPEIYTKDIFGSDYKTVLKTNPEIVLMSQNIFLYYIFKLNLDGIEDSLYLFRYDNDMSTDIDELLERLLGEDIAKLLFD